MDDTPKTNRDEVLSEYANNTFCEPSLWDLKVFFGQWYQSENSVDWHTAVTLPWPQIKLLIYFLRINLAIFEVQNGTVKIPEMAMPTLPEVSIDDSEQTKRIDSAVRVFFDDLNKDIEK